MSEPVSNAEVEDVLASIRRLVSEEKRPAPAGEQSAVAPSTAAATVDKPPVPAAPELEPAPQHDTGKLVLTPSLRVMQPDADAETETEDRPAADAKVEAEPRVPPSEQTAEADTSEIDLADDADEASKTEGTAASDVADKENEHASEADASDAGALDDTGPTPQTAEVMQESVETPSTLSAKIAALEAVIGKRQDQWEPDGEQPADAYSGTDVPVMEWEDHVEPDDPWTESPEAAPTYQAATAEEAPHQSDASDAAPVGALSAESAAEEDISGDLTSEDAFLDEDALRDLVAEIVRQELQGALGERITRNVRKLVRREIQRALAAQDLE